MEDIESKATFDLELIQLDRLGNILFIIGIIVAFIALDQEEQSIIQKQTQQPSTQEVSTSTSDIAKKLALANWIYFAAGLIFLGTSYARVKEQTAGMPAEAPASSNKKLIGSKVVTIGNLFKVIGYAIDAIGQEIIAGSTQ